MNSTKINRLGVFLGIIACSVGIAVVADANSQTVAAIAGQVHNSSGSGGGWTGLTEDYGALANVTSGSTVALEIPLPVSTTGASYNPEVTANCQDAMGEGYVGMSCETIATSDDNGTVNKSGYTGVCTLANAGTVSVSLGSEAVPSNGKLHVACDIGAGQKLYEVSW